MSKEDRLPVEGEEGSTEIPVTRPDYVGEEEESTKEHMPPEMPTGEHEESSEKELSEIEQEAMDQGWQPPNEFDADDKEFVSAAEFLRRGELFDKIKELKHASKSETRRLEKQIKELTSLVKESRKQGYEQALKDLEAQRQEAVETGDIDAFNKIDARYADVQRKIAEASQTVEEPSVSEVDPAALEFQDRNKDWFNNNTPENSQMVNQAISIDQHLANAKPYLTEQQRLQVVEKEMKTLYPHRFSNAKKKRPAPVVSANKADAVGSAAKVRFEDLDDRQKANCQAFLSLDPSLTVDDFIKAMKG